MVKILQIFQKMLGLYRGVLVVGSMKAYSRSLSQNVRQFLFFSEILHYQVVNKFQFFQKMLGLYRGVLVVGV